MEGRIRTLEQYVETAYGPAELPVVAPVIRDISLATMNERIVLLENLVGELTNDIAAAHGKLHDVNATVLQCARAGSIDDVLQRMTSIESKWSGLAEKSNDAINVIDATEGHLQELQQRLSSYERLKVDVERQLTSFESLLDGKLDAITRTNQSHIGNIEALFEHLMKLLHEVSGTRDSPDLSQIAYEMDHRLHELQDEQKAARELLEKSLRDQLHLEHSRRESQEARILEQCEDEQKRRQLQQDDFMDMLSQERSIRNLEWQQLHERLATVELRVDRQTPTLQARTLRRVASPCTTPLGSIAAPSRVATTRAASSRSPSRPLSPAIYSRPTTVTVPVQGLSDRTTCSSISASIQSQYMVPKSVPAVSTASAAPPVVVGTCSAPNSPVIHRQPYAPPAVTQPQRGSVVMESQPRAAGTTVQVRCEPRGRARSPERADIPFTDPKELGAMKKTAAKMAAHRDVITSASSELEKAIAEVTKKRSEIRSLSRDMFSSNGDKADSKGKPQRSLPNISIEELPKPEQASRPAPVPALVLEPKESARSVVSQDVCRSDERSEASTVRGDKSYEPTAPSNITS